MKAKVNKLFAMIEEKFKGSPAYKEWDVKVFIAKANQKCRDANRVLVKRDTNLKLYVPQIT